LYLGAKFVRDEVKAIFDGTKAKNSAKTLTKKYKVGDGNDNASVEKDVPDLDQFDGGDDGVNWDTLVDEVTVLNDQPASLCDFECVVNKNPAIHSFIFESKTLLSKILSAQHAVLDTSRRHWRHTSMKFIQQQLLKRPIVM